MSGLSHGMSYVVVCRRVHIRACVHRRAFACIVGSSSHKVKDLFQRFQTQNRAYLDNYKGYLKRTFGVPPGALRVSRSPPPALWLARAIASCAWPRPFGNGAAIGRVISVRSSKRGRPSADENWCQCLMQLQNLFCSSWNIDISDIGGRRAAQIRTWLCPI